MSHDNDPADQRYRQLLQRIDQSTFERLIRSHLPDGVPWRNPALPTAEAKESDPLAMLLRAQKALNESRPQPSPFVGLSVRPLSNLEEGKVYHFPAMGLLFVGTKKPLPPPSRWTRLKNRLLRIVRRSR